MLNSLHLSQEFPPLFGIGGGIITLSYFGVLLAWIKTHTAFEGRAKKGKHIQLIGYSFMYITALFLCIYMGFKKKQKYLRVGSGYYESLLALTKWHNSNNKKIP